MHTLQTTQYRHSWGWGDKVEEEPFIVSQTILASPLETLESPCLRAVSLKTQHELCVVCVCGMVILVLWTKHSFGELL